MGRSVDYHRPGSLAEACELLRSLGPNALPLAGGTDVLVEMHRGKQRPQHLVSLARLEELRDIALEGGTLRIGAMVTPAQLSSSPLVASARPELLDVVRVFGTPQVRQRATIGGNLCTAASCADFSPLLLVLGARLVVRGPETRQVVTMDAFFRDHRQVLLEPGQILSEVVIPEKHPGDGAAYVAFGLRASNYISVAGAAAYAAVDAGRCREARLALGAVAPTPFLVPGIGEVLEGGQVTDADLDRVGRAAAAAATPISDVRGSAQHRRELVQGLSAKALRRAWERAR